MVGREILQNRPLDCVMATSTGYRLLRIAVAAFGTVVILLYPLAVVWPSGICSR
ncbi:DUF6632 domain-containing protein [Mycobacterium hackensackense]|uniref:DUF6632 domain-containing protein n=1 Tax=Mycobacterium hackensackense TaxID=228909 RepID=UPI003556860F